MENEEDDDTPTSARDTRFPLAYDANGNPLDVPEQAVAWRVRRGGGRRGRPRHVFDAETGRQLEIPLGASLDELIDAGCSADRYLLYPVDAEGRVIPGVVAVTEVPEGASDDADATRAGNATTGELSAIVSLIQQQHATIRHQSEMLARALEATTSGYGRVRPVEPPPVVIEPPAAPPDGAGSFKPEQIAEIANIAKAVIEMFKGSGGQAPSGGGP
jgi:hypothetical protein